MALLHEVFIHKISLIIVNTWTDAPKLAVVEVTNGLRLELLKSVEDVEDIEDANSIKPILDQAKLVNLRLTRVEFRAISQLNPIRPQLRALKFSLKTT